MSVELLEAAAPATIAASEDVALFPTHVKVLRWQTEPGFNERLSTICLQLFASQIRGGKLPYREYNLWNDPRPELAELRRMFEAGMGEYVDSFMHPRVRKAYDFDMHAWLRIDRPKDVIAPHTHPEVHLAATYYSQVDIADHRSGAGSPDRHAEGSLVLLDPRPGVRLSYEKARQATYAVKPEVGMMVIIPSFLCHWVNPVSEGDRRICIANNMTLIRKIRLGVRGQFGGGAKPSP